MEEVLREVSSVPTWRRVTAAPTAQIPEGAGILLSLTGNGGPADLAFGIGIHRCLGAGLARMEARVALEAAADLLPSLKLTEEPEMIELLSFQAPARLDVEVAPIRLAGDRT